jgi:hypothetical protein
MNGFPLVLLGVVLFAVAYAMWKIQGKMKHITQAIDAGFKTIEDGVSQNLLGPTGALTKATNAVDQSYTTVETGVNANLLGSNGLLAKTKNIFNYTNTLCIEVGDDIYDGKLILKNDIRKTTGDVETILWDAGNPLIDAGAWLVGIGNGIDIDIAGAHPFSSLAQPFRDTGNTVDNVGDLCLEARTTLQHADTKIMEAEYALEDISVKAKALGGQILQIKDYVDINFRNGITTSMNDLKQATDGIKTLMDTLENGVQTSVNNLKSANTYLDSLLINIFNNQWIMGLAVAGVALIMAGVAIGI